MPSLEWRHVRGDVFAMVGGKRGHGRVIANLMRHLEVLSPSTQAYDRSKKFAMYWLLASLREYALIDPDSRRVEVFRPAEDGNWKLFDMSDGDALVLDSVACTLTLLAVFKGMEGD